MTRYRLTPNGSLHFFGFQIILLIGSLAGLVAFSPRYLLAQSSPLTIQPSTGNVGIGTTSPSYSLDVSGAASFNNHGFVIDNSWQPSPTFNGSTFNTIATFNVDPNASGGHRALAFHVNEGPMTALVTDGPIMSLESGAYFAGNVGIGTTSPQAMLHIKGGASTQVNLLLDGGSPEGGVVRFYQDGSEMATIRGDTPGTIAFEVGGNLGTSGATRAVTIDDNGNVGIGTPNPTSTLHVIGDITATGAKNFQITHPLEPDKKFLVHSALEGPEVAVYYRGEAQLVNGEVIITLPSYFEALTRKENRTAQLTPIKGWSPLYVTEDIQDGQFTVRTSNGGNSSQRFYWEVKAVRADVPSLLVEKIKDGENQKLAAKQHVSP